MLEIKKSKTKLNIVEIKNKVLTFWEPGGEFENEYYHTFKVNN